MDRVREDSYKRIISRAAQERMSMGNRGPARWSEAERGKFVKTSPEVKRHRHTNASQRRAGKHRITRGTGRVEGAATPFEGGEAGEDHNIPNHGADRSRGLGQPDVGTGRGAAA
jgi:hypothetical protein